MRLSTETVIARLRQTGDGDTLGGRIWRARDAAKLSIKELAVRVGVRGETISAWERDRAEPRTNRLFMLASVLGVTPAWLITESAVPRRRAIPFAYRASRATRTRQKTARTNRRSDRGA